MRTCPSCAAVVGEDDAFCGECGRSLSATSAVGLDGPRSESDDFLAPPVRPHRAGATHDAAGGFRSTRGSPSGTTVLPESSPNDEVLGQARPNEQYLATRLAYKDGEAESLDPLSLNFIKRIFLHWLLWVGLYLSGGLVFFILFRRSSSLLQVVQVLWALATGVGFWWMPVWLSISEWKFMVDGKAQAAQPAFEHITWVLRRRHTPVSQLRVHRLSLGGEASRDYLYVQDDIFRGYVSCFGYGSDLYVGWTFWWRVSPVLWLWIAATRGYQAITLRASQLHNVHRYDNAKALREALHGAAREGLDAATGIVSFEGTGTVGSEIPVEVVGEPRRQHEALAGQR